MHDWLSFCSCHVSARQLLASTVQDGSGVSICPKQRIETMGGAELSTIAARNEEQLVNSLAAA